MKILKQCKHCGNMFEAQKLSTKFCSHKCNSAHYKLIKRLEKKGEAEAVLDKPEVFKPKATALSKALIRDKDFLTVSEVAVLLGCSRQTVYSLVHSGKLKAVKIGAKKFLIARKHLNNLFEL